MPWFAPVNADDIPSPALLLHADRIEDNLARMIAMAGGPDRLCPHVKTHKIPQLVRRQIELGIRRFKCATIAEAEMAAQAGAPDVLLAQQPVGPNARRFAALISHFPATRFAALVDHPAVLPELAPLATGRDLELLIDLDIGQHRTGIAPGPEAVALARTLASTPGLAFAGLHAYDGHLHDPDPVRRQARCDAAFAPVDQLRHDLEAAGLPVLRIVAGGSPTFPFHARRPGVECSPGTCVFWDAGYAAGLPDLDFQPAAVLLARVVSRPSPRHLCLDLGHKAVASEMPHPRVAWLNLEDAAPVAHNEEHLVLELPEAANLPPGACLYGLPWHVCPTVALHAEAWVIRDGRATERWAIPARARRLTL